MKNWKSLTIAGILALVSVPLLAGQNGDTYGTGVALASATSITTLLAAPDTYLSKTVRVEGVVTAMCEKSGCWMQLTDANQNLRIKFPEGVVAIPLTAMGHKAAAEGTFEVNPASVANSPEAQHEANCPYHQKGAQTYQIQATGAVVYP